MQSKNNQQILIAGAVIFRENHGKRQFLVVKNKDDSDWEIPKVTVRRGESSVRAAIRMVSEQGGMSIRVLEEAGRAVGTSMSNGKAISQKYYYYLIAQRAGGQDLIGFAEFKWLELADAVKAVPLKKEKDILKEAKVVLKEWEKTHNLKTHMIEEG